MGIAAALLMGVTSVLAQTPQTVTYSGRLSQNGVASSGTVSIGFELFSQDGNGQDVSHWSEVHATVLLGSGGVFSVVLGETSSLAGIFAGQLLQLELTVDGSILTPRIPAHSVPYALRAHEAESLEGLSPDDIATVDELATLDSRVDDIVAPGGGAYADWTKIENVPPGLADGDDDSLANVTCSTGDVVYWTGTQFECMAPQSMYSDADAVAAMGSIGSTNALNHARYADADAATAMGVLGNTNPLHHARYTDGEAQSAMATHVSAADAHHTLYTDADAQAAVGAHTTALPWSAVTALPAGFADDVDNEGVTGITAVAPLASSGGATPSLSLSGELADNQVADAVSIDNGLVYAPASGSAVGINTSTPDPAAVLDLNSATRGFLPPRMTTVEREAIPSPPAGLIVFDTDSSRLSLFTGAMWVELDFSNLESPATPTITNAFQRNPAMLANSVDNDFATATTGASGANNTFLGSGDATGQLQWDFGANASRTLRVKLSANQASGSTHRYLIQTSSDGVAYTTRLDSGNVGGTSAEDIQDHGNIYTGSFQYVRVESRYVSGADGVRTRYYEVSAQ